MQSTSLKRHSLTTIDGETYTFSMVRIDGDGARRYHELALIPPSGKIADTVQYFDLTDGKARKKLDEMVERFALRHATSKEFRVSFRDRWHKRAQSKTYKRLGNALAFASQYTQEHEHATIYAGPFIVATFGQAA